MDEKYLLTNQLQTSSRNPDDSSNLIWNRPDFSLPLHNAVLKPERKNEMNRSIISLGRILAAAWWVFLAFLISFPGNAEEKSDPVPQQDSLLFYESLVNANRVYNNPVAKKYAREALRVARLIRTPEALIRGYFLIGKSFPMSEKDSSYFYYNQAVAIGDSLEYIRIKPEILYNLAMLYEAAFDYRTTIVMLDSAIRIADKIQSFGVVADAYNMLGNINFDLQDFSSAQKMYEKSLEVAKQHSLNKQTGNALSNLAKSEPDLKKSIALQKQAIQYLQKTGGTEEEVASIYINIGNRLSNPDSAIYYYRLALALAVKGNLEEAKIGAYNNMAYSYLDKGETNKAEYCVQSSIPIAQAQNNQDWLSTLYDSYADVMNAKQNYPGALQMQKKALAARIEADQQHAASQLRLLAVLLDTKNKELLIQNKEKEILIQQGRLKNLQLWLAISASVIFVFLFLVLWLQQRNRARLQREQIRSARRILEMEENEKGKIARELHDITGQLVMGITGEIENIEFPDTQSKDQLRNRIKDLGKSIRLISHRMNRAMMEHFSFEELIEGQCRDVQKLSGIPIHTLLPEEPMTLPEEVILHTYRIVQELLTNASKYVKGHQVWIRILKEENGFLLSYEDDGPGFNAENLQKTGMGLSNIFERAKLLGGKATVDSKPGKGTTWKISIPFHGKTKTSKTIPA